MARSSRQLLVATAFVVIGPLGLCANAWAVDFAGGTGEPNDPYQIATAEQLLAIGEDKDLLEKHFILMNSVDLSQSVILSYAIPSRFRGSFDGNGHAIESLGKKGNSCLGLFSQVWSEATVRNLGVVNARVRGGGILADWNWGTVSNCYSSGTLANSTHLGGGLAAMNTGTIADSHSDASVSTEKGAGGLVGANAGVLLRCYSTGIVTGDFNNVGGLTGSNSGKILSCYSTSPVYCPNAVGGLSGINGGELSDCYSTGEVNGDVNDVGGLVGFNSGRISRCYSTSPVTGALYVGGLVGTNTGQISSCYADANIVSDGAYIGGLVGDNWGGSVQSCYSIGVVAGTDRVGGLVGHSDNESGVATCYSVAHVTALGDGLYIGGLMGEGVADKCYFLDPADGGGPDNGIGTPLTDDQMRQQASFVGWDFSGTAEDENVGLWFMPQDAYPILIWQTETTGL